MPSNPMVRVAWEMPPGTDGRTWWRVRKVVTVPLGVAIGAIEGGQAIKIDVDAV